MQRRPKQYSKSKEKDICCSKNTGEKLMNYIFLGKRECLIYTQKVRYSERRAN